MKSSYTKYPENTNEEKEYSKRDRQMTSKNMLKKKWLQIVHDREQWKREGGDHVQKWKSASFPQLKIRKFPLYFIPIIFIFCHNFYKNKPFFRAFMMT